MTYRDEFDDPPRGGGAGFLASVGPKAAFFVVLIALSFMIGVVWKLYVGGGADQGQNVPIVRADDAPFKVTPEDPGGMEIPHKDSTIFSSLKTKRNEEGRIENLLAEDTNEEPLPRSQLFAGLNTDQNPDIGAEAKPSPLDQPVGEEAQKIGQPMEKPEEKPAETVAAVEPSPEPAVVVPKKVDPVIETKTEAKPSPTPAVKPEAIEPAARAPASGDYFIQLGSVKTKLGAETEWKKIVARYPDQLSGFAHRVETAELGEKGTFYRIQAGPVTKDKAVSVCEAIKKITPGACLLKKK